MSTILLYVAGGLFILFVAYHTKTFLNEKQFKREMSYFGRRRIAMEKLYTFHHKPPFKRLITKTQVGDKILTSDGEYHKITKFITKTKG